MRVESFHVGPRKSLLLLFGGESLSYLASTQLDALERETGCEVLWRPLYSVDLYRLRGASPFEGEPLSGQYDWGWRRRDAERWAAYYGVPYKEPKGAVGFDPCLLARACVAAGLLGTARPYSRTLFGAIFAEGTPHIDEEECARRAEAVGLDRDRFLGRLRSPEAEERLERTAREAHSAGAFGVPTFVVGDEAFGGNDRLVLVRHHLETLPGRA